MNRLSNKTALITGGTSGIGLQTAREFLSEGARVAVTGRNPKALEATRQELGNKLLLITSDAGDVPGQSKVAETIRQEFGRLDILFLNAGIVEMAPLEAWDESALIDRSISTSRDRSSSSRRFYLFSIIRPLSCL